MTNKWSNQEAEDSEEYELNMLTSLSKIITTDRSFTKRLVQTQLKLCLLFLRTNLHCTL